MLSLAHFESNHFIRNLVYSHLARIIFLSYVTSHESNKAQTLNQWIS